MEWEGILAGCVCDKSHYIRIKKKKPNQILINGNIANKLMNGKMY